MQTPYKNTSKSKLARWVLSGTRVVLALAFVFSGSLHFARPEPFMHIVPAFLPFPRALVLVSGLFEILGGIGLLLPFSRRFSGYGLIALLIAVFPANITMAFQYVHTQGYSLSTIFWILRLPFQFVLIEIVRRCALKRA